MRRHRLILPFLLPHFTFFATANGAEETAANAPPNIILFMTDDQDVTAHSLDFMQNLSVHFRAKGMEFLNYYVPTGLCCPSRATVLRGQYCHNTKVFDNGDLSNSTYKSGAWDKFVEEGLEEETIATMLQSVGYETALIGKYLNGYMGPEAAEHVPPGFDHWMAMLRLYFYGPVFSENGVKVELNDTVYQTDFIRDWVVDFLTTKRDKSKPFFLMVTPFAPHTPATPAKRHEGMFEGAQFPRFESFNPSDEIQQTRPAWIKDLPSLTQDQIDSMDNFYQNRLESLQAVDEALGKIVATLRDLSLEDNTYFFYTADNGQHFGSYRIPAGKRQAYESDVLVPFLVRGPGITPGVRSTQVVQSVDLAPTFLELATRNSEKRPIAASYPLDGESMVPLLHEEVPASPKVNQFRWAALLEMYGGSSNIGLRYKNMSAWYHNHMFPNTYQAIRVVNGPGCAIDANLLYVEWCTGEQELYNMTVDPHQVSNIVESTDLELINNLSRLLAGLGDCEGSSCYEFAPDRLEGDYKSVYRQLRSREDIKVAIRERLPCHNPPNMSAYDVSVGRKLFAANLPVPEPFHFGFPYSDDEEVPRDMLELWKEYEDYFY